MPHPLNTTSVIDIARHHSNRIQPQPRSTVGGHGTYQITDLISDPISTQNASDAAGWSVTGGNGNDAQRNQSNISGTGSRPDPDDHGREPNRYQGDLCPSRALRNGRRQSIEDAINIELANPKTAGIRWSTFVTPPPMTQTISPTTTTSS
ncbi:MAG: hypothetical protein R2843_08600 [Thermomicrobiales bacterium]